MRPTTLAVAVDLDAPVPDLLDRARTAERLGFDRVYVPDHSRNWRVDPRPGELWFDGWTVLTAMAMATSVVGIGTLVSNPVLRPPDLLVREALAVDHLSEGRLLLGIGTGIAGFDHDATGTPYWSLPERLDRFREYVAVVDDALRAAGGRYDHRGKYFRCSLTALPAPPQRPRPPITVAGISKAVRATAVERADCWNTHGAADLDEDDRAEQLAVLNADMTARCEAAGRDPASLGRSVLLFQSFDPWTSTGRLAELTERVVAMGYDEVVVFWPWDDRRRAVFERDVTSGLDQLRGA